MFGTGLPEIIIIVLVALLLFGPAALTFWLGYTMGSNRSPQTPPTPPAAVAEASDTASEESDDE